MLDWHGSSSQQSSRKRAGPSGCKVFFPSTIIDTRESKTPSIGNRKVQPCSGLINFEFVQPSLPRRLADVHNSSSVVNQKKEPLFTAHAPLAGITLLAILLQLLHFLGQLLRERRE